VGSLARNVGSRPLSFARIVGSQATLFASPRATVCRPLHLGFDERVTKRIQRDLEREGLVDLTTVPPMTHMGRPVMDHAPRHRCQQTIGMTPQGMRVVEDLLAMRADTARPTLSASPPA
jgi:hypothetical protein